MTPKQFQEFVKAFNALADFTNKLAEIIYVNQMHEHDCPRFMHEKHYAKFPDHSPSGLPPECTCWLSKQGRLDV